MGKRKKDQIILTRTSAVLFTLIILAVGFIGGVAMTVFKTGPSGGMGSASGKNFGKMATQLESMVAANPKDTDSWVKLGNIYFDTDQYQKAINAYSKAMETGSETPFIICDLGVMYRRNGQPELAIKAFDRALAMDSKFEMAYLNKGIVLVNDFNKKEEAIKVWRQLLEINPLAMAGNDQTVGELITHYTDHPEQ
jgi:tetratricopeptide (TPR) repeat protein